jgi:hypothetical protein
MRMLSLSLCVIASSCNHIAPEEQALVDQVEHTVVLPEGGGTLQCYERHYAVLSGEELRGYFADVTAPPERILVGTYIRGEGSRPGVYLAKNEDGLPAISDAGCSALRIFYVPGDTHPGALKATCSPNVFGFTPDVVDPPVTC